MSLSIRTKLAVGIATYMVVFASNSLAAPSFVKELPKDKITVREALKQARAGKIVFKCQRARITEAGGIGKAKGATTAFHVGIKDDETTQDQIMDGGKGYKCQPLQWDAEKRKLSNAQDEQLDEA